ncbi:MAG: glycoside hydrolase family 16 protein [Ilumatobacteraceae bacterium]
MQNFRDDFVGAVLDTEVWVPHYLPAWSSRAASAAVFELGASGLRLFVPPDMGRWCPDSHDGALRVSGIQSGNRSGPVGSNDGQQRFRDELVVTEAQPTQRGWLPSNGRVEITCRMTLSQRSMAAMWLSGFEERADDGGELCVVEIFGRTVDGRSAAVGVGVKALHDPRLDDDFVDHRLPIDIAELHTYAVEWGGGTSSFHVDGEVVHRSPQSPSYPMQVMMAVFDFPDWSSGDDDEFVPEMVVRSISGYSG